MQRAEAAAGRGRSRARLPRRGVRAAMAVAVLAVLAALWPSGAGAQPPGCSRVVVFTLPGVTWREVQRVRPPALLELAHEGATASVSVRTIGSRTSYAAGFATLGAGTRVEAPDVGAPGGAPGAGFAAAQVAGLAELRALAKAGGYRAVPGALGEALDEIEVFAVGNADLGRPPPAVFGTGRWTLFAAMDATGHIDNAATSDTLIEDSNATFFGVATDQAAIRRATDEALQGRCGVTFVDHGDLERAEQGALATGSGGAAERAAALLAADDLLGQVAGRLDFERDLLVVVSPTSPAWLPEAHLGVAIARGPGFPSGAALRSAITRRPGLVTLLDVGPTVLRHLGLELPGAMTGQPWTVSGAGSDRIEAARALDEESVFVDAAKSGFAWTFIAGQTVVIALLAGGLWLATRRSRPRGGRGRPLGHEACLLIVAFPAATFLAGIFDASSLGGARFAALVGGLTVGLVLLSRAAHGPVGRLALICAATTGILIVDVVAGAHLQINTLFGYSPIVAGRFAGIGNFAFAVLGASAAVAAALAVELRGSSAPVLGALAALFVTVVIADGAPAFGSDVGGVIALVPGLGVVFLVLTGHGPSLKFLLLTVVGMVLVLGAFLLFDLSRPPESRTHFARLFQDVASDGPSFLLATLQRKASANLDVARSSSWTLLVPPQILAGAAIAVRSGGVRAWTGRTRGTAAIVWGGGTLALLGFAVNDSGVAIAAMMLSFFVPALIVLATDERGAREPA